MLELQSHGDDGPGLYPDTQCYRSLLSLSERASVLWAHCEPDVVLHAAAGWPEGQTEAMAYSS